MKIKLVLTFICSIIFAHEILGSCNNVDLREWIMEMPGFGSNPVTTPAFFVQKIKPLSATSVLEKQNEIIERAKISIEIDEKNNYSALFLSPQSGDTPLQAAERAEAYQRVLNARIRELLVCFRLR